MTHTYVTLYMWHDSFVCHDWFIRDMNHPYVAWLIHMGHDSFTGDMTTPICRAYLMCVMTNMWHDLFICDMTHWYVTWLIDMWHDWTVCDVPHSCVSWFNVHSGWLMQIRDKYMCDTTRSCVTRPIYMSDTTHSYVIWLTHMWHDSFIYYMTHSCVKWLIHKWHDASIRDVTHSYVMYSNVTWLIDIWRD